MKSSPMNFRFKLVVALFILFLAEGVAQAQGASPPPACAQMDANLPPELAGWTQRSAIVSASRAADLGKVVIVPGKTVVATLHPTRQVTYVTQPQNPGGSVAYGGMLRVRIAEPGTYRFTMGAHAWIDVLKNGVPVTSTAHKGGAPCTTIHKNVEFPLKSGDYVLQVSANAEPTLPILIVRRP